MTMLARRNPKPETQSIKDLCAHFRNGSSTDVLLECYANLDPDSADVARLIAWSYRYQRRRTPYEVLGGNGHFYNAWKYDGASFESVTTLASIHAHLVEQNQTGRP
jgi:hypothetical protein